MKSGRLRRVFLPSAAVDPGDTGLQFTDILFGFVIFQLFQRMQRFGALPWFGRWQLIVATTLVLGSWIGFRLSVTRSRYRLKFFNLPLFRFVLDQAMVILYFHVAALYPNSSTAKVAPSSLVHSTILTLLIIFGLYWAWDILAVWMAYVREESKWKYPKIVNDTKSTDMTPPRWIRMWITALFLGLFALLYLSTHDRQFGSGGADAVFGVTFGLLLGYRLVKEVQTSWSA
jgi:hypothetical protein